MSAGTGALSGLATSELRKFGVELKGEIVQTGQDATRAADRGYAVLAGDLRARRARLERLALLVDELLRARPNGNGKTPTGAAV